MQAKLEMLGRTFDDKEYWLDFGDKPLRASSSSAALAKVVEYRVAQLGALEPRQGEPNPIMDAMFARKEPKTGPDGTMSWSVDVQNPATEDNFAIFVKELILPNGQRRPFSVWISGQYPREMEALCKLLSMDMRVIDPAWIGMKLRKLLNYAEPQGDFFARLPGSEKSQSWPSTEAYLARLIIHRYAMLDILTEEGYPVERMGVMVEEEQGGDIVIAQPRESLLGARCKECGNHTVIKKDGCDFCTSCGFVGGCG